MLGSILLVEDVVYQDEWGVLVLLGFSNEFPDGRCVPLEFVDVLHGQYSPSSGQ